MTGHTQGFDFTFQRVQHAVAGGRLHKTYPRLVVTHSGGTSPIDVLHLADFFKEHGDDWPCKCERGAECMKPINEEAVKELYRKELREDRC